MQWAGHVQQSLASGAASDTNAYAAAAAIERCSSRGRRSLHLLRRCTDWWRPVRATIVPALFLAHGGGKKVATTRVDLLSVTLVLFSLTVSSLLLFS